MSARCNRVSLF